MTFTVVTVVFFPYAILVYTFMFKHCGYFLRFLPFGYMNDVFSLFIFSGVWKVNLLCSSKAFFNFIPLNIRVKIEILPLHFPLRHFIFFPGYFSPYFNNLVLIRLRLRFIISHLHLFSDLQKLFRYFLNCLVLASCPFILLWSPKFSFLSQLFRYT